MRDRDLARVRGMLDAALPPLGPCCWPCGGEDGLASGWSQPKEGRAPCLAPSVSPRAQDVHPGLLEVSGAALGGGSEAGRGGGECWGALHGCALRKVA